MNLPGSPRTHVWIGLLLSLAAVLVGGYAYTGDRAFDIWFLPVAVLAFLVMVAGSLLVAYGQANKPRMGGKQAAKEQPAAPRPEAKAASKNKRAAKDHFTLACATCRHVFTQTGKPPFLVTCPNCQATGRVEAPPAPAQDAAARPPLPGKGGHGPALRVTLSCSECAHVFSATGAPPLVAMCPNCGHRDQVQMPRPVEPTE